jgi:hypothetical protein
MILPSAGGFPSSSLVFSFSSSLVNTFVGGTYLLVLVDTFIVETYLLVLVEIFCVPGQRLLAVSILLLAAWFAFSYY